MSYRTSCYDIKFNTQTFILSAQCNDNHGALRPTSINLAKCIAHNTAANKEGLEPNTGAETTRGLDREVPSLVKDVHLADANRYLRAQTVFRHSIFSGSHISTLFNFKDQWKWAQVDLDAHLRNADGQLEFVTPLPKQYKWVPEALRKVAERDDVQNAVQKAMRNYALGGAGMEKMHAEMQGVSTALWGIDERMAELKAEEMKWWEGTYIKGGCLVRPGT